MHAIIALTMTVALLTRPVVGVMGVSAGIERGSVTSFADPGFPASKEPIVAGTVHGAQISTMEYPASEDSTGASPKESCPCSKLDKRDPQAVAECTDCFNNNIRQVPTKEDIMGLSKEPQSSLDVHTPTYDESTPATDAMYASTPIPGQRKIVVSSPGPFNYPNGTVMNGTAYPSGTHAIMSYGKKNNTNSGPFMDITRANSGADSHLPAVMPAVAFWIAAFWALVSVDVHA